MFHQPISFLSDITLCINTFQPFSTQNNIILNRVFNSFNRFFNSFQMNLQSEVRADITKCIFLQLLRHNTFKNKERKTAYYDKGRKQKNCGGKLSRKRLF